jgi:hypothetical protein
LLAVVTTFPTKDEYVDPNPIISGFSTCYIDLILLSESQEFREPPETPVAVTYSEKFEQIGTGRSEGSDAYNLTVIFNMKRIKINCLALFIFSTNKNQITIEEESSVQNVLKRYFSSIMCPTFPIDLGSSKNAYLTLVENQNSDVYDDYALIISRWIWKNGRRRLPIFYLRTSLSTINNKVSLSVKLLSPCLFHNSVELLGMENMRQEFDNIFSAGQRKKCANIVWMIFESEINATRPCVSLAERSQSYDQLTSGIISLAAEPFFNSTAMYYDYPVKATYSIETQHCRKARTSKAVMVNVGFQAAGVANKQKAFPIYEIVYE